MRKRVHCDYLLLPETMYQSSTDMIINFGHNTTGYPAYCDCEFPHSVLVNTHKGHIPDLVQCRCGEESWHTLHWSWDKINEGESDVLIVDRDVTFHPTYSQGTAIVCGNQNLKPGMIHHWEIRILTPLSGTDVMIGIGTDNVDPNQFKFNFVSALGTNSQSWGFSYQGKIHHNGETKSYGERFSQGCIVGVCLDRARGRLEFFLNRRSLGVAFDNIPLAANVKIYPMICSTAAKSAIRLMNATSQRDCLQLRAFKALSKQPKAIDELRTMPGLVALMHSYWFLAPPVRYSPISKDNEIDILDEAVISASRYYNRRRKQKYKVGEDGDSDDIYANAHKIANNRNDHDEDINSSLGDYFDEYFHYIF